MENKTSILNPDQSNLKTPIMHRLKFGFIIFFWPCILFSPALNSCRQQKTTDLLPDSAALLVRINFPELATQSLRKPEFMKGFIDVAGFDPKYSGLDFFQPAYLFQGVDKKWNGCFFTAGISSSSQWETLLKNKTLNPVRSLSHGFKGLSASDFLCVWNDKIALMNFFRGISGPMANEDDLIEYIRNHDEGKEKDPLPQEGLLTFKINWAQQDWFGREFDFQLEAEGKASLRDKKLVMDAEVMEENFSNMILPFPRPEMEQKDTCGISLAFKPDIKMMFSWLKMQAGKEGVSTNFQLPEALDQISGPFWASATGCDEEGLKATFQISAPWPDRVTAEKVEKTAKEQIPLNQLEWHHLPGNWLTLSMPGISPRSVPSFNPGNPALFFMDIRLKSGWLRIEASTKKKNRKFSLHIEAENPGDFLKEKLRLSLQEIMM